MNIRKLRTRILLSFYILVIIPTVIITAISLNNTTNIVEKNFNEMTKTNLEQVGKRTNLTLDGYKDLLYQLYIDDDVAELVKNINNDDNMALARSQLIRKVREVANLKPYIESVMIIPREGDPIFFDKLTAASTKSSWKDSYPVAVEEMYRQATESNQTLIYPTAYAATMVENDYYLFHITHRIIDYQNLEQDLGIVIFSLNQQLTVGNYRIGQKARAVYLLLSHKVTIFRVDPVHIAFAIANNQIAIIQHRRSQQTVQQIALRP